MSPGDPGPPGPPKLPKIALQEATDDTRSARECGILGWRPMCLQNLAGIKVFVCLLSFLVTLQQALASGYINSVITTIEKRFEIPSSLSGLVASAYEVGNVTTVIFVSYLGSRRHIPVWIAMGAVIMAIGSVLFAVPHFSSESYSIGDVDPADPEEHMCRAPPVKTEGDFSLGRLSTGLSSPPDQPCIKGLPSAAGPVLLFLFAQLLLGCGGSPLFTLGTTYIDDHVRPDSSSLYIGCMYSMAAFGPVVGFLLGAYLLSFHVDSFSGTGVDFGQGDRRWIGMWWGGFLIGGILMALVAIPFLAFPKTLEKEKERVRLMTKRQDGQHSLPKEPDPAYGKDIKDIPRSMWRLVSNPVYVVTCLGACMELVIVSGFIVFLPKYLETQFSLSKSQASVFTGSVAIPGACIGIFLGGCILKKLQLQPSGAVQFVLLLNALSLACHAVLLFLGCNNVKMAGTTTPYPSGTLEPFRVNLTAACNFGCECRQTDVEPVCGADGLTYFSPCYAGCTQFSSTSNYSNCACIPHNSSWSGEVTAVPMATAGPCVSSCSAILPFMLLLFFMTLTVAITQMPLLMVVLRSVRAEERSFALGMQFVIFRLFGYIPSPILFGNLIDSTCLLWKSTCGESGGRCLLYDIEQFRYRYVGLCVGIKTLAFSLFLVDWRLIKQRANREEPIPPSVTEILGSVISLDKLFEDPVQNNAHPEENIWLPDEQQQPKV